MIRLIFKGILYGIISFVLLVTLPGLLDIKPASISLKPCPKFEGALKVDDKLDSTERLFEDQIEGPESIAFYNGALYTGLADGRIVRIEGNQIRTIAQIAKCEGVWEEQICGRPLGLKFDSKGNLFVANAYYGLYRVDVNSGRMEVLYSSETEINGKKSAVVNDLDLSKSGKIYFSDSGKWTLVQFLYGYLEAATNGRVLVFDPKTKSTEVVVEGISFANGIQLSPDEDFLLICETAYHRILKYNLKGSKKGTLEIFIDNLPGSPDNIRLNSRGNYWVAQCSTRLPGHKTPMEILGHYPLIRRAVGRLIHVFQSTIHFIKTNLIKSVLLDQIWYRIAHFKKYAELAAPKYGLIVELDGNGKIIRSLHSPNGSTYFVSEVCEHDNYLYLGSPWHEFLGRLKL